MEHNFTSLNIKQFKETKVQSQKKDVVWIVFLLLGVVTLLIVSVVLFVLIQKKLYG